MHKNNVIFDYHHMVEAIKKYIRDFPKLGHQCHKSNEDLTVSRFPAIILTSVAQTKHSPLFLEWMQDAVTVKRLKQKNILFYSYTPSTVY